MEFRTLTVTRTHRGRTFTLSAMVSAGAVLDLEFEDRELPLSWWRRLRRLPPKIATVAKPIVRTTTGATVHGVALMEET